MNENITDIYKLPMDTILETTETSISTEDLPKAIKYSLMSYLIFSFATCLFRYYSNVPDFDASLVFSLLRNVVISSASYMYLKFNSMEVKPILLDNLRDKESNTELKWMVLRAILLFIGNAALFYSIMHLKQIYLVIIFNLSVIFQVVIGPFISDQKFKLVYLYITIIAFIGILIMLWGNSYNTKDQTINTVDGFICIFLCSIMYVFVNFSLYTLNKDYDAYNLNYISSFWSFAFGLLLVVIYKGINIFYESLTLNLLINTLINGCLVFVSFCCQYISYYYAEVQKVGYISFIEIPTITLFGYIAFGETINFTELIGFIILLSVILYSFFNLK